ncbi:MAG TPA: AraC family transcriptional regulator [Chryseolinea sp.]
MWISIAALLITSSVGALQSFFFGIYLFTIKKGRSITNVFLAVLLLAFAARITKSIGYYFAEDHKIPDLLMNIGFGCNLAIFPLLWLYLNAFLITQYRFEWKRDLVHLIPAAIVLSLSTTLTDYFWMQQYGYFISLVVMLAYLPFCIHLTAKHFGSLTYGQRVWVLSLVTGITIVWLSYLLNFVFGLVPYIAAPVVFSIFVYFLTAVGLKQSNIFIRNARYEQSVYTDQQLDYCYSKLMQLFAEEKIFKDASLTLPKIAKQIGVSNNLLSETINTKTGGNFPDFINSQRVKEAQTLLSSVDFEHQKIAAVAYEVGFNSLSVFNAAFKKFTSETPSAYRKQHGSRKSPDINT